MFLILSSILRLSSPDYDSFLSLRWFLVFHGTFLYAIPGSRYPDFSGASKLISWVLSHFTEVNEVWHCCYLLWSGLGFFSAGIATCFFLPDHCWSVPDLFRKTSWCKHLSVLSPFPVPVKLFFAFRTEVFRAILPRQKFSFADHTLLCALCFSRLPFFT